MPYFASLLLVATTTMMLGFTSGTFGAAEATPKDMSVIKSIFTTSTIFHSYLIGIVAGKISEESIASGFKHASILILISLLAAKLVPLFITF